MSAASSHRPASRPLRARRRSLPVISSRRSPAGGSSSATRGSKANRCGTPIDHNKEVRRQRGSRLNPLRCRRDQPSGHQLEAVMIIQLLVDASNLLRDPTNDSASREGAEGQPDQRRNDEGGHGWSPSPIFL